MPVDLFTSYLGLRLRNPLAVSSCPLTGDLEQLKKLEDAGVGAVVLPSLFEEQIEHGAAEIARLYDYREDACSEGSTYFPELARFNTGPERYLLHLKHAKKQLRIPVIASLNGTTPGGWTRFARQIEDAGADALELNIYFVPTDPNADATAVENFYVELVESVRSAASIPLAVKVGPYFSSLPHVAKRLEEAGANGLVLFNRFLEPSIDTNSMTVDAKIVLSDRRELTLPLRWVALLRGQRSCSLAVTTGIHVGDDLVQAILAGADVGMVASALLKRGPDYASQLIDELAAWMEAKGYGSVDQFRGALSHAKCANPSALERVHYTHALVSYNESPATNTPS